MSKSYPQWYSCEECGTSMFYVQRLSDDEFHYHCVTCVLRGDAPLPDNVSVDVEGLADSVIDVDAIDPSVLKHALEDSDD